MKYMTALPLSHSTGAILLSQSYSKKLPKELLALLTDIFPKSMQELTLTLRSQNSEAIELLRESGLTIVPVPSGPALTEFYKVHDQVAQELAGEIYPKAVLEKVYGILRTIRQ
jgi:TRAP-type C4-dicarboxylate transport system substrate-binding protein